jgi:acyl-coenzyme A synthetase/AMP-(fatty) acid ligase
LQQVTVSLRCLLYLPAAAAAAAVDMLLFALLQLNACYNAVDKHIPKRANQIAIIHEGDEPGSVTTLTYSQLLAQVCRVANALKEKGVKKVNDEYYRAIVLIKESYLVLIT